MPRWLLAVVALFAVFLPIAIGLERSYVDVQLLRPFASEGGAAYRAFVAPPNMHLEEAAKLAIAS